MDYIESNLRKEEEIVIRAKISWWTLVGPIIFFIIGIVLSVVLTSKMGELGSQADMPAIVWWVPAIIFAIPLIKQALINATTHLAVTNKRVIGKVGVLRIDTIDYPVDKIDNVSYKAGFFGNIFKYANVQIGSVSGEKKNIGATGNAQKF